MWKSGARSSRSPCIFIKEHSTQRACAGNPPGTRAKEVGTTECPCHLRCDIRLVNFFPQRARDNHLTLVSGQVAGDSPAPPRVSSPGEIDGALFFFSVGTGMESRRFGLPRPRRSDWPSAQTSRHAAGKSARAKKAKRGRVILCRHLGVPRNNFLRHSVILFQEPS